MDLSATSEEPSPAIEIVEKWGPAVDSPGKLESLDRFGKYQLLKRLGEGSMGVVFLAQDTQVGRLVALKITRFTKKEQRLLGRFLGEAQAAGRLQHPNVCIVHDVNAFDGNHYIDMEFITGSTYAELVQRESPLDPRRVAMDFSKIARALYQAHQEKIIHRDLKPSNIMMRSNGEPVIMDFGLARLVEDDRTRLTFPGELVGTIGFIPPEQMLGISEDYDGAMVDIYALGVTMYFALTGRVPFPGQEFAVLLKALSEEAPPPTDFRPDLDPQLAMIVVRMIARDPRQRFPTMLDVAGALDTFLSMSRVATWSGKKLRVDEPESPRQNDRINRLYSDAKLLIEKTTELRDRLEKFAEQSASAIRAGREDEWSRTTEVLQSIATSLQAGMDALNDV